MPFLKSRLQRKRRKDLLQFLQLVLLYLQSGFDLHYAWTESITEMAQGFSSDLANYLTPGQGGMMGELTRLSNTYPTQSERVWFQALARLYETGGELGSIVRVIVNRLSDQQERELADFIRTLSGRLNIAVILFFLPPTLLLIFLPLWTQFQMGFSF